VKSGDIEILDSPPKNLASPHSFSPPSCNLVSSNSIEKRVQITADKPSEESLIQYLGEELLEPHELVGDETLVEYFGEPNYHDPPKDIEPDFPLQFEFMFQEGVKEDQARLGYSESNNGEVSTNYTSISTPPESYVSPVAHKWNFFGGDSPSLGPDRDVVDPIDPNTIASPGESLLTFVGDCDSQLNVVEIYSKSSRFTFSTARKCTHTLRM
jgi:hypothetical protein